MVALDGDRAGLGAAMRLVDLALPLLEAGKSLRFALMPEGQDPDDVLKRAGTSAMARMIEGAIPMVDLLWRRETEGRVFDSPERRAALDRNLRNAIKRIQDPSIRSHYGQAIKDKRWQLFRAQQPARAGGGRAGPWKGGKWGRNAPAPVTPTARASVLASGAGPVQEVLHEAVILATLIARPALVEPHLAQLERLEMSTPDHRAMLAIILAEDAADSDTLRRAIVAQLGQAPLDKLFAAGHVRIAAPFLHPEDSEIAAQCLAEELAKLEAPRGARREVEEAAADMEGAGESPGDEGMTWRLGQAAQARNQAWVIKGEDSTAFDVADNGALIDRNEQEALEALLQQVKVTKKGNKSR